MKPWRKQFGIWVPDRSLTDNRGFISPAIVGAVAGSRRRSTGGGGISLVASVAAGSSGGGGFTSSAINTSGAGLIVACLASYSSPSEPSLSDAYSNTYTQLTAVITGAVRLRIFYKQTPSVGGSHTFTITGSGTYANFFAAAYTQGIYESQNTGTASGTTIQPGSVTPSVDGALLITCLSGVVNVGAVSINGSYTINSSSAYSSGNRFPLAVASWVQTTASASNPTWTTELTTAKCAAIAVFTP